MRNKKYRKKCPICGSDFFGARDATVFCSLLCTHSGRGKGIPGTRVYKQAPRIDLSGRVFGSLSVAPNSQHKTKWGYRWMCRCNCGTEKSILGSHLIKGKINTCGCGQGFTTHGMARTPTYHAWQHMRARCTTNPSKRHFKWYAARGIKVCSRWEHSFENFLEDMGVKPDGLELDRINNDGNYEPSNCRWTTKAINLANRRPNRRMAA